MKEVATCVSHGQSHVERRSPAKPIRRSASELGTYSLTLTSSAPPHAAHFQPHLSFTAIYTHECLADDTNNCLMQNMSEGGTRASASLTKASSDNSHHHDQKRLRKAGASTTKMECLRTSTPPPALPTELFPQPRVGILKTIMKLRGLSIADESTFDFEPPASAPQWPSVRYGRDSPHLQYANASKLARNKHNASPSKTGRPIKSRKPKISPPKPKQASDAPSTTHLPLPKRDTPLHLLSLPRELRDDIYGYIATSTEPLYPQIRRIWLRPQKHGRPKRKSHVFPREPSAALANRQLHHEVLSTFYGSNHFILTRPIAAVRAAAPWLDATYFDVTTLPAQKMWCDIRKGVSPFLRKVDLQLTFRRSLVSKATITIEFRRAASGQVDIRGPSRPDNHCLCVEEGCVKKVKAERDVQANQDVLHMLQAFSQARKETWEPLIAYTFKHDEGFSRVRLGESACEDCGRQTFLYVGGVVDEAAV